MSLFNRNKTSSSDNSGDITMLIQEADACYNSRAYEPARKRYEAAAKQGSGYAYCMLGKMYERGEGVKRNNRKIVDYYSKASQLGYALANNYLGCFYVSVDGIFDVDKSVFWLKKGIDCNEPNCMYTLSTFYKVGDFINPDPYAASQLDFRAAQLGDPLSQECVAHYYEDGEFVQRDLDTALYWYNQVLANTAGNDGWEYIQEDIDRVLNKIKTEKQ